MLLTILRDELRFLTFRPMSSAVREHANAFLAFGLLFTWFAGIGRYWDNPRADLWQYLGLGSVIYVFLLALLIWLMLLPLRPSNWSYRNVLLFITLTAPPAVLYAIPVERFLSAEAATTANMWFLASVAAWRVALYAVFLSRVAKLSAFAVVVGTLTPLVIIVVALTALNLEHVVFSLMSGIKPEQRSSNDAAYGVVVMLTFYSVLASPILLISYVVLCFRARYSRRETALSRGGRTFRS